MLAWIAWIVEAVVVGKKRDATRTRLLNELTVLAIIFNFTALVTSLGRRQEREEPVGRLTS